MCVSSLFGERRERENTEWKRRRGNGEEGRGIKKTKIRREEGGRQEFFYKVPGPRMAQSSIGKDRALCRGNWATEPRLSSGGQVGIHKDFCGGKALGCFRTAAVSVVTATRSHVKFALHRVMSQQQQPSPDSCRHNSHAQRDGPGRRIPSDQHATGPEKCTNGCSYPRGTPGTDRPRLGVLAADTRFCRPMAASSARPCMEAAHATITDPPPPSFSTS